jgi:hypothetical protein
MAIPKDSRSFGKKRPPRGGNSIRTHPVALRRPKSKAGRGNPGRTDALAANVVTELTYIWRRLKIVLAVSVTVDQALRNQNSEQDLEFADCLRWMVSDRLADSNQRIENLVGRIGGRERGTMR